MAPEVLNERKCHVRRKVAQRLVSVKYDTAMLTAFNEVDMSAINAIRKEYKEVLKNNMELV